MEILHGTFTRHSVAHSAARHRRRVKLDPWRGELWRACGWARRSARGRIGHDAPSDPRFRPHLRRRVHRRALRLDRPRARRAPVRRRGVRGAVGRCHRRRPAPCGGPPRAQGGGAAVPDLWLLASGPAECASTSPRRRAARGLGPRHERDRAPVRRRPALHPRAPRPARDARAVQRDRRREPRAATAGAGPPRARQQLRASSQTPRGRIHVQPDDVAPEPPPAPRVEPARLHLHQAHRPAAPHAVATRGAVAKRCGADTLVHVAPEPALMPRDRQQAGHELPARPRPKGALASGRRRRLERHGVERQRDGLEPRARLIGGLGTDVRTEKRRLRRGSARGGRLGRYGRRAALRHRDDAVRAARRRERKDRCEDGFVHGAGA